VNKVHVVELASVAVIAVCYIVILIALWNCYRRTARRFFLIFAICIALWPPVIYGLNTITAYFVDVVASGEKPWLFPFSLMGEERLAPREFLLLYSWAKELIRTMLVAVFFVFLVKSFPVDPNRAQTAIEQP